MTGKNFINFHVLISHSPSCLNRDDMNMQKTAVFGGVNRVRVSSQSLKRSLRMSDYYGTYLGQPSCRTRSLERVKQELIRELGSDYSPALVEDAANRFVMNVATADDDGDAADESALPDESDKKLAVAPWVKAEIREICRVMHEVNERGLTDEEQEKALKGVGKKVGKGKDKKELTREDCLSIALNTKITKSLQEASGSIQRAIGQAVDIALSGRMATSGLMTSIDGALAVAHAITTHAVEPQDVDWFTAVDDLTEGAGETGAGHLSTQQFSAGVFYRYASLNLKQLQVNLGLLESMKSAETTDSRRRALEIAKHVFHMLATVVPSAKQQSFAAHNLADFAIVSFGDIPISLANAFEEPVKRDYKHAGYLRPSIEKAAKYWERMNKAYGLAETAAAFSIDEGIKLAKKDAFESLAEVEAWIERDGQSKEG